MPEEPGWRSLLSFSDRLAVIATIATKLQETSQASGANARTQAREMEKSIYETAADYGQYNESCNKAISSFATSPTFGDLSEEESDSEAEDGSPTAIGGYTNAKRYRDGIFSTIFKATGNSESETSPSSRVVALKVTTPSMMVQPHDSEREVRILQTVRHENIIPLIDSFRFSGSRLVLVFPFVAYDLKLLNQRGGVTRTQARSHLRDLFRALEFLNLQNIIHRDIKPSNLLLKTVNGPAYLADFGIAWSPTDSASEPSDFKITDVGTTSYRPPELLFGNKSYGCGLDLWAAGCIVAETVNGDGNTLFDAGDLGSELALIQSIFKKLGTPNLDIWPEASSFPDWGKMAFYEYETKTWIELLPGASADALDLVSKLIRFESSERLSAADALKHKFFEIS